MAARLYAVLLAGVVAAGAPAAAQHHDAPSPPSSPHHDAPVTRASKASPLGVVAPAAPTVAPAGHRRTTTRAAAAEEPPPDGMATGAAGGRTKRAGLRKGGSPADVAASINQRLAELAELRRTAPVSPPRRPAPKRDAGSEVAAAPAAAPAESPGPAVRLRWRVFVNWPDVTSSAAAAVP